MRAKCVKNVRAQLSLFPPYKLSYDDTAAAAVNTTTFCRS